MSLLDSLVLPTSVYCSSLSDEIDTLITLGDVREATCIFVVWRFSKYFKTAESRMSSLLLSALAFLFPTLSEQSSIVSCFNLSLLSNSKVVNVLSTLSMALFDDEKLKIISTKSKISRNSFWWFLNSWNETSIIFMCILSSPKFEKLSIQQRLWTHWIPHYQLASEIPSSEFQFILGLFVFDHPPNIPHQST